MYRQLLERHVYAQLVSRIQSRCCPFALPQDGDTSDHMTGNHQLHDFQSAQSLANKEDRLWTQIYLSPRSVRALTVHRDHSHYPHYNFALQCSNW